jgi:hypothetical protein
MRRKRNGKTKTSMKMTTMTGRKRTSSNPLHPLHALLKIEFTNQAFSARGGFYFAVSC